MQTSVFFHKKPKQLQNKTQKIIKWYLQPYIFKRTLYEFTIQAAIQLLAYLVAKAVDLSLKNAYTP